MLSLLKSCSRVNEEVRLIMPACQSLICRPGPVHAGEHLNTVFGAFLNPTSPLHAMLPRLQRTTKTIIEQPEADPTYWCLGSAKLSRELRQFVKDSPLIEQVIVLRKSYNVAYGYKRMMQTPDEPLFEIEARVYKAQSCRAKYLSPPESCPTHDWVFIEQLDR